MDQPGIRRGDGGHEADVAGRDAVHAADHVPAPRNRIALLDPKPLAFGQQRLTERILALAEPTRAAKHALAALDFASGQFHSGVPVAC
jgi:hypothetical protein